LNRRHAICDVAEIEHSARVDENYIYVSTSWGNLFPAQKQALSRNGFKSTGQKSRWKIFSLSICRIAF